MDKYGFKRVREYPIPDIDARAVEYRHTCGARLLHIDRRDENKTFMIAFGTPPTDSTGVFHIIEHSVLCGSDKYPVKEPFVELLKSSLNTFLNAMTYPDKTVYPVSSMNERDFLNLVSVYMDAVFHPAFLKNEAIFMQEGHRLTNEGGAASENGVVLSEMLGAYSSAEEIESEKIMELLYPNSPYAYSSGGDPDVIPSLTYESFVDTYKRHYSPERAYIVLDGDVPLSDTLSLIDSYLSGCEIRGGDIELGEIPDALAERRVIPYSVGADESCADKTRVSIAMRTFSFDEREKNVALAVIRGAIASAVTSPLPRAILESGLCEDVQLSLIEEIRDGAMVLNLINVKDGRAEELIDFSMKALRSFAERGLDKAALSASLSRLEFTTRERNYGYPAGIVYALAVMDSWLYSPDPVLGLSVSEDFAFLRRMLDTDYFERLLLEVIPESGRESVLILTPDAELSARLVAERAARAEAKWAALTDEERAEQEARHRRLDRWQTTPDSPEAAATLPRLSVSDINPDAEKIDFAECECLGVPTVAFDIKTAGICYINLYFDICDIAPDDSYKLALLCSLIDKSATDAHSSEELISHIKSNLGFLNFSFAAMTCESGEVKSSLKVSVGALADKLNFVAPILSELLYTSHPSAEDIEKVLRRTVLQMREDIAADGTSLAVDRANARFSESSVINDYFSGIEAYRQISKCARDESASSLLADELPELARRIFTRERASVYTTANVDRTLLEEIVSLLLPSDLPVEKCPYTLSQNMNEGIEVAVNTAFTAYGFEVPTAEQTMAFNTVKSILNYEYLWGEIRAKGGAYGTGEALRQGFAAFYSYRDPAPAASIEAYRAAADFLRGYAARVSDEELEGHIIGSFAALGGVRTSRSSFDIECVRHRRGVDYELRVARRREILETSREDILRFADVIERGAENAVLCTVSSRETLTSLGVPEENTIKIV